MKHFLRYSLMCVLSILWGTAFAQTITFEAAADNAKDAADATTLTKDGITLKLDAGSNTSDNPVGTLARDDNYRIFKGNTLSVTSTVGKITFVEFTCTANGDEKYGPGNLDTIGQDDDDYYSEDNGPHFWWHGSSDEVVFEATAAQVRATKIVVYIGEDGEKAYSSIGLGDIDYVYLTNFPTDGQGDFTINDVKLGDGLSYVWKHDSSYGMKASAYAGGSNIESESWLISPAIDLTEIKTPELGFEHAINKYFGDVTKEATAWIREVGGEWKQLEITYPTVESKTFSDFIPVQISLSEYEGKKIQVGFKYTSTSTSAGTWEIQSFYIAGIGGSYTPDLPDAPEEINVAKALEIISGLADKEKTENEYVVTGYVVGDPDFQRKDDGTLYGNVNLEIADEAGGTSTLTVFRAKSYDNESFTEETINLFKAGDKVVFQGKLQKFGDTPELVNGYLIKVGEGSEVSVIAEWMECTSDGTLKNDATDNEVMHLKFYSNNTADWWTVTQGKVDSHYSSIQYSYTLDGSSGTFTQTIIKSSDPSEVGQTITIPITYKDGILLLGEIYYKRISGNGPFDDETSANEEINVAKALEIVSGLADKEKTEKDYIVSGYVVGAPDFQRNKDGELYGNVNLTIADEAGGTSTLTVFRAKSYDNESFTEETLNLFAEGDFVVFQGKLQKYGDTPELVSGYLIKVEKATGIQNVKISSTDSAIYNLAGQQVEKATKGIYIQNGRKFVVK